MEHTMKYLIKFLAIIGLVSMSHVAIAIDNVSDGDILEAAGVNEVIDDTNANSEAIAAARQALADEGLDGGQGPIDEGTPPGPGCVAVVGDEGPGGGLIFFVTSDKCRGLEVSKIDLNDGASTMWGCSTTEVRAYGEDFGDGYDNTSLIIGADCSTAMVDAANLTVEYTWPGADQTDGYLPAIGELEEMYEAIGPGADNAGNFSPDTYWSSTEDRDNSPGNVWAINFDERAGGSFRHSTDKLVSRLVRAVRIFNLAPPP
jgi:hypothetical protein